MNEKKCNMYNMFLNILRHRHSLAASWQAPRDDNPKPVAQFGTLEGNRQTGRFRRVFSTFFFQTLLYGLTKLSYYEIVEWQRNGMDLS